MLVDFLVAAVVITAEALAALIYFAILTILCILILAGLCLAVRDILHLAYKDISQKIEERKKKNMKK